MNRKTYLRWNDLLGWTTFGIAAWTYLSTVEPSISFWDCPEYVACAVKGEVGHPPGNAFFLLMGRVFANAAGDDISRAALWMNRMSALFSAGTILFLYWTITALVSRLLWPMSWPKGILTLGSGLVGALAYTWSDTFWFSAVEAEVYAFSSFMTALTFWLMLKWEARADEPSADRYLILIAYVVGLSIGVHLLNLLCLPAIVLIAYHRRCRRPNRWRLAGALALSLLLIAVILYGLIPGVVWLAQRAELLAVNGLGLPYNTGTLFSYAGALAIIILLLWRVYCGRWHHSVGRRVVANGLLSLLMLLAGYSTFAQVLIRASAAPPINENAPSDAFALGSYLNRDQYGQVPLLWGQTFASRSIGQKHGHEGRALWAKALKPTDDAPDRYYVYGHAGEPAYDYNVFFPRMYSDRPEHLAGYKRWSGYVGLEVNVRDGNGRMRRVKVPTWRENMAYFLNYQVGHMYWRYFLWNFCGRQNDLRGNGEADRGNWVTGWKWVDRWLTGSQEDLPCMIAANKGHNVYYMLPLLLGLAGMVWQLRQGQRGRQGWLTVALFFFMTGLAIVIYLNQPPNQPRERDYAYAGSFYAFSIWIGMGVCGLWPMVRRLSHWPKTWNEGAGAALTIALCLAVPLQMVGQTWDDHDRSERWLAHDFGRNYLAALDRDAIIFVNGDNETFPLWYAQEVEGFRRDVRVCNLAYLQTDWYIDQMKSPAYESPALPIPMNRGQYAGNNRLVSYVVPRSDKPMDLHRAMDFLLSDDARTKTLPDYAGRLDYLPARKLQLRNDVEAIIGANVIRTQPGDSLLPQMDIELPARQYLMRNEIVQLAMIDSIARDGWHRPIYFPITSSADSYVGMEPYLRLAGLVQQVVPLANEDRRLAVIDVERTYDCVMNRFRWGNADKPGIYLDETAMGMCLTHRLVFGQLIEALLAKGDTARAVEVADRARSVLPACNVPDNLQSIPIMRAYLAGGRETLADEMAEKMLADAAQYLRWAASLSPTRQASCQATIYSQLRLMHETLAEMQRAGRSQVIGHHLNTFNHHYEQFKSILAAGR